MQIQFFKWYSISLKKAKKIDDELLFTEELMLKNNVRKIFIVETMEAVLEDLNAPGRTKTEYYFVCRSQKNKLYTIRQKILKECIEECTSMLHIE